LRADLAGVGAAFSRQARGRRRQRGAGR
jgi:hypothetical protein